MDWQDAPDVKKDIVKILKVLDLDYVNPKRIFCYRTTGSRVRAYARTWAMPKIFQKALEIEPAYVIEVLSKYYDKQNDLSKKQILIHELLHIPKNFSGALAPHRNRSRILHKEADRLFKVYIKNKL